MLGELTNENNRENKDYYTGAIKNVYKYYTIIIVLYNYYYIGTYHKWSKYYSISISILHCDHFHLDLLIYLCILTTYALGMYFPSGVSIII